MSPVRLELPAHLSAEHATTLSELTDELDAALGEELLGLVLSGSAGRGRADTDSDLDLFVVITEDAGQPTTLRPLVDLIPATLAQVQQVAEFGDDQWGYRWSWAWAPVLLDRTDGALTAAVERQTRLSADETTGLLLRHGRLDAWINLVYRALKSARRGDREAAALDGAESVPVFLDVVFALAGLVRPYNSSLRWALEHHPLPAWPADRLLGLAQRMSNGEAAALHEGLAAVRASCAAEPELSAVLESWPPEAYGVLYR